MAAAEPLVLAIDQGTSSTKALLVDGRGDVVARSSAAIGQTFPAPGWVEQSAEEIAASVRDAVAACVDPADAPRVVGVGISTQRESLVLWDRATGDAVGPVVTWQDQRTVDTCRELAATGAGELVRERSGLPLDPMFSALKARWLLDAHDPQRQRSRAGELCLGTIDSWLLSRFGGEHVTEVSNASRTQLMDVDRGRWDDELLELFAVPAEVLGTIVPSVGPFPTTRGLAPLADGTPVLAVLGDSHAALFAHAGWRPGVCKATYGTGSSIMAVAGRATAAAPDGGVCRTVAWDLGDGPVQALEGNIRSSGRTLTWLADLFATTTEQILADAAATDPEGVSLVPAFGGLGAPWWEPDASALIAGLTLGTRREHLAAAAVHSVVAQVEDVVDAVAAVTGGVEVLLADGGLTRSSELMQRQADYSRRRVARSSVADLSALGVAHLAGLSAGLWDRAGLESLDRPADEFTPQQTTADAYARHAAWHEAIDRSRPPHTDIRRARGGTASPGADTTDRRNRTEDPMSSTTSRST
ncbi:MAG: FGGY family carbohydrate kinase [Actinomycetota bacterium]|nr:FGGY family carbohydrate kinase [Actinomycetota bacterium]